DVHRDLHSFPTRRSSDLESNFYVDARNYVENEVSGLPDYEYIKKNIVYKYDKNESYIVFNTYGLSEMPQTTIDLLKHRKGAYPRSEEHTSELQSRENLVC